MTRFAQGTQVPIERSRAEIEKLLQKHHATSFAFVWDKDQSVVQFEIKGRWIRSALTMPKQSEFTRTGGTRSRTRPASQVQAAWEQGCRERWRSLLLVIKAKLEAVQCGITTIEQEFLAWMVTANGETVGQRLLADADRMLHRGPLQLLSGGSA